MVVAGAGRQTHEPKKLDVAACFQTSMGESLHCALLLDYVPPEEPQGMPLGNTLRIRRPKLDWRGPWRVPGSCGSGEGPGAFGGEDDCVGGGDLNLGWQRRWTPSCIADSPLSTHLGSIPSGGVHLQPSQPPWQEVTGHEGGSMMSYSRHPESVSPYQSTEKKSRCSGNG